MCVTSSFPSCAGSSAVDGRVTLADAVFVFRGRLRSRGQGLDTMKEAAN